MKKFFVNLKKLNIAKLILLVILGVAIVVSAVFVGLGFRQSKFDLTFYEVKSDKVIDNIRVVGISDLHLKEFGQGNSRLIEQIRGLHPDIIAVVGDLTTEGKKDYHVAFDLLKNLKDVAPVYYSYGNHEYHEILSDPNSTLRNDLKKTGVNVVNNDYETVTVNGSELAIGGFCAGPKNFYDNADDFLEKYMKADGFKLLLTHHVEVFESCMEGYPVDLAISGHAHGGHARLPFIGALYAPDQGLLPDLTEGMQTLCGSEVIISRGLGNSHLIPRFNNNPEIIIADINWY